MSFLWWKAQQLKYFSTLKSLRQLMKALHHKNNMFFFFTVGRLKEDGGCALYHCNFMHHIWCRLPFCFLSAWLHMNERVSRKSLHFSHIYRLLLGYGLVTKPCFILTSTWVKNAYFAHISLSDKDILSSVKTSPLWVRVISYLKNFFTPKKSIIPAVQRQLSRISNETQAA